jgi:hypothetical protein
MPRVTRLELVKVKADLERSLDPLGPAPRAEL